MSVFITFAAALLIFGAVIAIHEFGHFAVAKLCGVQVNEFSIGMGPTLIKTYRKGTQYTLRLLPVGGFVALEGEESPESEQAEGGSGDDDGPDIPPEVLAQRTGKPLNEAAVWQRMLVMAAGAVMNFVLGFVVLLLLISLRSEMRSSSTTKPSTKFITAPAAITSIRCQTAASFSGLPVRCASTSGGMSGPSSSPLPPSACSLSGLSSPSSATKPPTGRSRRVYCVPLR